MKKRDQLKRQLSLAYPKLLSLGDQIKVAEKILTDLRYRYEVKNQYVQKLRAEMADEELTP